MHYSLQNCNWFTCYEQVINLRGGTNKNTKNINSYSSKVHYATSIWSHMEETKRKQFKTEVITQAEDMKSHGCICTRFCYNTVGTNVNARIFKIRAELGTGPTV
jgi:hypothetical protein